MLLVTVLLVSQAGCLFPPRLYTGWDLLTRLSGSGDSLVPLLRGKTFSGSPLGMTLAVGSVEALYPAE